MCGSRQTVFSTSMSRLQKPQQVECVMLGAIPTTKQVQKSNSWLIINHCIICRLLAYSQIPSNLKTPNNCFCCHFPYLNESTHVSSGNVNTIVAEQGMCHRITVIATLKNQLSICDIPHIRLVIFSSGNSYPALFWLQVTAKD